MSRPKYLQQRTTGRVYVYSPLLARRGDMAPYDGDPTDYKPLNMQSKAVERDTVDNANVFQGRQAAVEPTKESTESGIPDENTDTEDGEARQKPTKRPERKGNVREKGRGKQSGRSAKGGDDNFGDIDI